MARAGVPLDTAQPFPGLQFDTVRHGSLSLPDGLEQRWSVLLFYRAHW